MSFTLFEVSWEVCNKVGGGYTVVSSKARQLTERLGDGYLAVGPWLLERTHTLPFEEEAGHEEFLEACRQRGIAVKVGRWSVPGRPRTLLVSFSNLFPGKDQILSGLWERFRVDSLSGGWDYIEPVVFGHAAAMAIEVWHRMYVEPKRGRSVVQCHDWLAGAALLYLRENLPEVGTVLTVHTTTLGRAVSAAGTPVLASLRGESAEELAERTGVEAKHSLEGVAAREADVLTAVSQITAEECEHLYGRQPQPLVPNGLDLELLDELASDAERSAVRAKLLRLAAAMTGEDLSDASLALTSGRYEFHNKGLDLTLAALAELAREPGPRLVLFAAVPAGNSGLRRELRDRLNGDFPTPAEPLGISTHQLFDPHGDPIQRAAQELGLTNPRGGRVFLIQVPIYLDGADGLFDLQYETVLRAMDVTCFPSFYDPWGYTPAESIGVGVPTITSDCSGFGIWASEQGLGARDGVDVLARQGVSDERAAKALAALLDGHLRGHGGPSATPEACLAVAGKVSWKGLIQHHLTAFDTALERAAARTVSESPSTPRFPLPVRSQAPQQPAPPALLRFDVAPTLPPELAALERLSRNLWWSWDPQGAGLFEEISPRRWRECGHNPVVFLRRVFLRDLQERAADPEYVGRLGRVLERFEAYMGAKAAEHRFEGGGVLTGEHPAAYFCLEFGVHESLRIYSGGLGVLAGDHLKSASDLNLPLVGVGLLYRKGYVDQRLSPNGEQLSSDVSNDPRDLPLEPALGPDGEQVRVEVQLPDGRMKLAVWRLDVGRIPLYLLDADLPENEPAVRAVTQRLYDAGQEMRLLQEIALGRGGMRALEALGLEPAVLHMNEGHAAFAALERIAMAMRREDMTFHEAREWVRAGTVFTTHTPVPAGHDVFSEDLMRRYFSDVAQRIGLPFEPFLALGAAADGSGGFNMTYLSMSLSGFVNGVAKKHGEVSRGLLHPYWSALLENEVPVTHVTNGIHLATWVRPEFMNLLGASHEAVRGDHFADRGGAVDPARLWEERQNAKRVLLESAARSLQGAYQGRQDSPRLLARILEGLRSDALLIGFARRFAPYKRATLLFKDRARLEKLLSDESRPVRFLFSGKSHPADQRGKDMLREIAELTRSEPFIGRVIFLENYDMALARHLVQGVDVWLNNPIRPLEASGTSGMKVSANGGLNLSVLDGWWIEGYDGGNGWAIGGPRLYSDQELQDQLDNEHLLRLLEDEVAPCYFERDERGLPQRWLSMVQHNLATIPPFFNTDRMVGEYAERAYGPLAANWRRMGDDGQAEARQLAARNERLRRGFEGLRLRSARIGDVTRLRTGDHVEVEVEVEVGELNSNDLRVELVLGHHTDGNGLSNMQAVEMTPAGPPREGVQRFTCRYEVELSGSYGYGVRARLREASAFDVTLRNLVRWS